MSSFKIVWYINVETIWINGSNKKVPIHCNTIPVVYSKYYCTVDKDTGISNFICMYPDHIGERLHTGKFLGWDHWEKKRRNHPGGEKSRNNNSYPRSSYEYT